MAGARLVHEGAVLTCPHGRRGGVRGAPDSSVLLEARKLHSNGACGTAREAVGGHSWLLPCPRELNLTVRPRTRRLEDEQPQARTDGALGTHGAPHAHPRLRAELLHKREQLSPSAALRRAGRSMGARREQRLWLPVRVAGSLEPSAAQLPPTRPHRSPRGLFSRLGEKPRSRLPGPRGSGCFYKAAGSCHAVNGACEGTKVCGVLAEGKFHVLLTDAALFASTV